MAVIMASFRILKTFVPLIFRAPSAFLPAISCAPAKLHPSWTPPSDLASRGQAPGASGACWQILRNFSQSF
jgi:hypothetical protein